MIKNRVLRTNSVLEPVGGTEKSTSFAKATIPGSVAIQSVGRPFQAHNVLNIKGGFVCK